MKPTARFNLNDRVQHRTTRKLGRVARTPANPGTRYGVISVRWDGVPGTMACLPHSLRKIAETT